MPNSPQSAGAIDATFDAAFAALSPFEQEVYLWRLRAALEHALVTCTEQVLSAQKGALQRAPRFNPQIHLG